MDLGLGIKYSSRDLVIPGYAQKVAITNDKTMFEYSEKAVNLIKQYCEKFPEVFNGVNKAAKADLFDAQGAEGQRKLMI